MSTHRRPCRGSHAIIWGDLYIQKDGSVEFLIPPGKSCKFFRHVALAAREDALDLLTWLRRLATVVPIDCRGASAPLFVSFHRRAHHAVSVWCITRRTFIRRFKQAVEDVLGFSPILYAGYSLRRGGVTELLERCSNMAMVKRHVGWAKNSTALYDYYDHSGKLQLLRPTQGMGMRL